MHIIGHRGNSATAPENTLSAFEEAFRLGAHGIELDVALTKDQQVAVFHDKYLRRTTNGVGRLADKTYPELTQLDAGSWFSSRFSSERIPLLRNVFEKFGTSGKIIVDIKDVSGSMPTLVDTIIELIQEFKLEKSVTIQSFHDKVLQYVNDHPVKSINTEKFVALYVHPIPLLIGKELNINSLSTYTHTNGFGFDFFVTKTLIAAVHKLHKDVYFGARAKLSYKEAEELAQNGLDYLMRNDVTPLLGLQ